MGARAFDRRPHRRLFMHGQVVEHHDIARPQGRHQDLLDVGQERRIIDRPVEHGGRREPVEP